MKYNNVILSYNKINNIVINLYMIILFLIILNKCKDYCVQYKFIPNNHKGGVYVQGGKRCRVCDIFIKWDGMFCPCCGTKLRCKPGKPSIRRKFNGVDR